MKHLPFIESKNINNVDLCSETISVLIIERYEINVRKTHLHSNANNAG